MDDLQGDQGISMAAEGKTIFEEIDAEIEARAIAEAEAEIDAGKGVPHAKVGEWLLKLAKGKALPPPCK
jgi:predicted transcriptional regulator